MSVEAEGYEEGWARFELSRWMVGDTTAWDGKERGKAGWRANLNMCALNMWSLRWLLIIQWEMLTRLLNMQAWAQGEYGLTLSSWVLLAYGWYLKPGECMRSPKAPVQIEESHSSVREGCRRVCWEEAHFKVGWKQESGTTRDKWRICFKVDEWSVKHEFKQEMSIGLNIGLPRRANPQWYQGAKAYGRGLGSMGGAVSTTVL